MTAPDWIAADWGTSHLRLWLMDESDRVLHRIAADCGMGSLARDAFEPALLDHVGAHLAPGRVTPVICCGMAGSRQGWAEAPYARAPCLPPTVAQAAIAPTTDPRLEVRILPGIAQDRPADVMRGEETQISGWLAAHPGFDGVLCLPGTHCKWVQISAGEVVSFRTFMTGELFALLSRQSVLRHSLSGEGWDDDAFAQAVAQAMSHPGSVAADLFTIRAQSLLQGLDPAAARARLSGLLIGLELGGARPWWLGQDVAIIGAPKIAAAYQAALRGQGMAARLADAEDMTLRGLIAARRTQRENAA